MDQMICYNCFRELGSSTNFCRHCGFPVAQDWEKNPTALPYGTVLGGRYITGRVLGQGGFGITYLAQDHRTKQLVAIKEFFPDTMAARGAGNSIVPYTGQRGEDFNYGKTTFLEEARTIAQFNDTPGIVHVYSYFEEFGTAYFAMEYIDGMNLQKYIEKSGGRITWDEAKQILVPVMDALAKVHAKGIIHRDIKPDNIRISREGEVKVLDFGSARYSMGEKSRSLDVVLTHGFAPREQYSRHGRQGAYTDVYALAATFYYSITGKKPPDSIDRIDEDTIPLPSALGAQIPSAEEDVILKALSVEPQDRYQTMVDFKAALLNPSATPAYAAPQPAAPAFAPPVQPQTPAYQAPQPAAPAYTAPQQPQMPKTNYAQPSYTPPQPQTPAYTAPQPQTPAYTAPQQTPAYTASLSTSRPAQSAYQAPQQAQAPRAAQPSYTQPAQQAQAYTAPKPAAAYPQTATQSGAYPSGYTAPQVPAKQQKKKKGWVLPTVIGVAAAAIILVVALVLSGAGKKQDPKDPSSASTTTTDTKPDDTPTPAPGDPTDISSSGKTETPPDDEPHTDNKPKINIKPAPTGDTASKVYGFYAIRSLSMNGVTMDVGAMEQAEIDVENTYVLLNTDHSGEIALGGDVTPLSWTDDRTLVIDDISVPFTIRDGELTFTVSTDEGDIGMVFSRQGDAKPEANAADPAAEADGKCGDNIYWRFDEDTLYLFGSGSTYDFGSTDDIPWFDKGVDIDFVVVGEGIERIGDGCFFKCQMVSVELPSTLTSIGYLSFGFCPYLGSVEIPTSVSYLGDGAFYGSDLSYAYVYSRSLSMDIDVFAKCESLTDVYFYGSIVGMGLGCFTDDTVTIYYPGDDRSWNEVIGNDYGGAITWQTLGDYESADWYSANKFSIGLPADWAGTYTVNRDDTGEMLIVYHKASADAGTGGMLFCFRLYSDYSEYEYIPDWRYIGFITNGETEYTLIAILPSDVQFPPEQQEAYTNMLNSLYELQFSGENGWRYSAQ